MSEPAKGVWRIGTTDPLQTYVSEAKAAEQLDPRDPRLEVVAFVPAAAQVVEMPASPGERPCVYVRGERVLQWMVMRYGTEIVSVHESVAAARSALERSGCHSDTPDYCMCALVVIETRTKEEPARE